MLVNHKLPSHQRTLANRNQIAYYSEQPANSHGIEPHFVRAETQQGTYNLIQMIWVTAGLEGIPWGVAHHRGGRNAVAMCAAAVTKSPSLGPLISGKCSSPV